MSAHVQRKLVRAAHQRQRRPCPGAFFAYQFLNRLEQRVGYRANDVCTAYLELGSPAQLTRAQVERLRAACTGGPEREGSLTVGRDGVFEHEVELRESDVLLVRLTRRAD